jgi:hypothetical protein
MKRLPCLVVVAGVLAAGCAGGTETGNPPGGVVSLGLTAFSTAPDVAAVGTSAGGLSIDRVVLGVHQLVLVPCAAGATELALDSGEYDLTDGNPAEVMGPRELCGLRLLLAPAQKAGRDLPAGVAMYLHGLRTDGSTFDMESTTARALSLNSPAGTSFGSEPLLLGFDVGRWFTSVDVHGAHAGADGIAHLDASLNPTLLAAIEDQTVASVRLYADSNGNGTLDDDERTPVASP